MSRGRSYKFISFGNRLHQWRDYQTARNPDGVEIQIQYIYWTSAPKLNCGNLVLGLNNGVYEWTGVSIINRSCRKKTPAIPGDNVCNWNMYMVQKQYHVLWEMRWLEMSTDSVLMNLSELRRQWRTITGVFSPWGHEESKTRCSKQQQQK